MSSSISTASLAQTPAPEYDVSDTNLAGAADEFHAIVGAAAVLADPDLCHSRSSTPWTPTPYGQRPALVVQPSSTDQVSQVASTCWRRRIPLTVYAGGTNLPGALVASRRGGVLVDFARMCQVVAVHEADMDAVVQPGVGWRELNAALEPHGLFFPPDPGPGARIGGMIAMSCSGTNAYRYGTMKEWVVALTVVLADGTIVRTRRRPRKSSAGYDLTRLMIGSEGTLGLVTEAVLKLAPAPKNLQVAVVTFLDVHAAVRAGLELIHAGLLLEAVELLDGNSMRAINLAEVSSRTWDEKPTLFLKFAGAESAVTDLIRAARDAAERNQCVAFEATADPEQIDLWWSARKDAGKSLLALKNDPSDVFIPSDAAVPISRLADLMVASQRLLEHAQMNGSVVGHLGDGNIHVVIACKKELKERGYGIVSEVQNLALEMDGTVTGEHGVGLSLRDKLVDELGVDSVNLMRKIKLALDPLCILNCDKVVRMEAEDPSHL